jgi:hypothetical protein
MLRIIRSKETSQIAVFQDPSRINGNNLSNINCETSRHFKNRKLEYLKDKVMSFATTCKNKNIRELFRVKINLRGLPTW